MFIVFENISPCADKNARGILSRHPNKSMNFTWFFIFAISMIITVDLFIKTHLYTWKNTSKHLLFHFVLNWDLYRQIYMEWEISLKWTIWKIELMGIYIFEETKVFFFLDLERLSKKFLAKIFIKFFKACKVTMLYTFNL